MAAKIPHTTMNPPMKENNASTINGQLMTGGRFVRMGGGFSPWFAEERDIE